MPVPIQVITFLPKELLNFFYWWYFEVPQQFLIFIIKLLGAYLDRLAVPIMARSLFVPMFHDYTITGRALSFFFRISRIIFGLFVNLLLSLVLIVFYFTWIYIPILVVWGLYLSLRS